MDTNPLPEWAPEAFKAFWSAYPIKECLVRAVKEWDWMKMTDTKIAKMMTYLENCKQSGDWGDTEFPLPADVWLCSLQWDTDLLPRWAPEAFKKFWEAYPFKRDRLGTVNKWDFMKMSDAEIAVMMADLEDRKRNGTLGWSVYNYIPDPYGWLMHRLWAQ